MIERLYSPQRYALTEHEEDPDTLRNIGNGYKTMTRVTTYLGLGRDADKFKTPVRFTFTST
jgi:hypothetical protein